MSRYDRSHPSVTHPRAPVNRRREFAAAIRLWAFLFVLAALVVAPPRVLAGEYGELAAQLDKLVTAPSVRDMRAGIRVEALGREPVLVYEHLADEKLKPASNMKLVTTSVALRVLPEDFTYRTLLAQRGRDLVVIGAGDPSLGDPRLAKKAGESVTALFHTWADLLLEKGVTTIEGDLVFDDYLFEQEHIHPAWKGMFNLQAWYAAPVGGLNFNDNCIDVVIQPAPELGKPAVVELIPDTPWVQLNNLARTAARGEPVVHRSGSGPVTLSVSGTVSKPNSRDDPLSIAIIDPGAFFASTLRTVLASKGIRVVGDNHRERVRSVEGELPAGVQVLATHDVKLEDVLWRVNKSSQNMFAESIFKTLGAYDGRRIVRTGGYETGRAAVSRELDKLGIAPDQYVLDDGSGLSHNNRVTANMIVTILKAMDHHPRRKTWWTNLAAPGEEVGTLRRRMLDLEGKVFAKTGTIGGVSSLSGYVIGAGDRFYAFSVLCNDTQKIKGGSSAATRLQDTICRTLATWDPSATSTGG